MKTIHYLLLALLLTSATTGCQQCLSRFRGARCRPGIRLPTFQSPSAQREVAPCTTGCNSTTQPVYVQPQVGMTSNGTIVNDIGYDDDWTGSTDTQVRQRPIITSGTIVQGVPSPTDAVIIPGPESGPLPVN